MPRERRFGPTFQECAAPEAIRAHLVDLRRKRNTIERDIAKIERDIAKLENLLVHRSRQMQRGEWPPPTEGDR